MRSGQCSEVGGWLWGSAGEVPVPDLTSLPQGLRLGFLPAQLTQAQGMEIAWRELEGDGVPRAVSCTGGGYHSATWTPASPTGRDGGSRSWGASLGQATPSSLAPKDFWPLGPVLYLRVLEPPCGGGGWLWAPGSPLVALDLTAGLVPAKKEGARWPGVQVSWPPGPGAPATSPLPETPAAT